MLHAILERIGYDGVVKRDAATLFGLHRAWRRAVPYENLDIQLGRPVVLDDAAVYDKLIRRGRGGYCYEQNSGLAMLLRGAGFDVTMVEGAVLRETRGADMWGNHNVLLVDVEGQRWVADAGIGDGFLEPLPLREGAHTQGHLTYRLERIDPDTWRFHHHPGGTIASYDFRLSPREIDDFAAYSHHLSTSLDSAYVTTLMAARPSGGQTLLLLSRTVRTLGAADGSARTISSLDEFSTVLSDTFAVPLEDLGPHALEQLWSKAGDQHGHWRAGAERAENC